VRGEDDDRGDSLILEDISYRHPGAAAQTLEHLDLRVPEGSFVALTGESGAGKSTLIDLCLGERRPVAGRIRVLGVDITRLPRRRRPELRRHVSAIFQDYELLPDRTVAGNVAFTLEINGYGNREIALRVAEALDLVGLVHRRSAYPRELSGGEQQRVAVARTIALRPRIILADEPTGNLDEANSEHIFELLATLSSAGTTVLVATHDTELVRRYRLPTFELADRRVRTTRAAREGR